MQYIIALGIEIILEAKERIIAAIFIFARLILTAIGLQVVSYFYKGNFTILELLQNSK